MPVSLQELNPKLATIIQDNILERVFHDALFPKLLFRSEAQPEKWVGNLGERVTMTRSGEIEVDTTPLIPGQDPVPSTYDVEQWTIEANQYGKSVDTHMPTSHVALAPKVLRDAKNLGLNAGKTLNTLVRDRLYRSYLAGNTVTVDAALISAVQIHVASLNGFTETLLNGEVTPVNPLAPIEIEFGSGTPPANNFVIAASPDTATQPLGPGILTLQNPLSAALGARVAVLAINRSRIIRVGNGESVDALTGTNIITLNSIIQAVGILSNNNVPPHPGGYYHCHLNTSALTQLYQDAHWQTLHTALPDSIAYRDLVISNIARCLHYENTESPNASNTGTLVSSSAASAQMSPQIGGEVVNDSGIQVARVIITGAGAIYEKYLDESKYISEAGVTGKIGNFSIVNNGMQVMTNRIRYIMRAPLDRLQQTVAQSWSWSGDFAIPSDSLTGDNSRFKRSIVIEHAA